MTEGLPEYTSAPETTTPAAPVVTGRAVGEQSLLQALQKKADERPPRVAPPSLGVFREVVESLAIACILAFLFRTFEAEVFMIPTGSMAPTLMGRHKDLVCPKCGLPYRVGASGEVEAQDGRPITHGTCPQCRYVFRLQIDEERSHRSFAGDYILVSKLADTLRPPRRWDVMVFRFPGNAKQYYIKRLAGLPGERLAIYEGDLYRLNEDAPPHITSENLHDHAEILRKPPRKLVAMLQHVYDTNHTVAELIDTGFPTRWESWTEGSKPAQSEWKTTEDYRTFEYDGRAEREVWLRYLHYLPSRDDWDLLESGERIHYGGHARPIRDFYAYNNGFTSRRKRQPSGDSPQFNEAGGTVDEDEDLEPVGTDRRLAWVGDLAVEADVEVLSEEGVLLLELAEGGVYFTCRIDLATGRATLSHSRDESFTREAQTDVQGPGHYRFRFANVDDELTLWIDGRTIDFGGGAYGPLKNRRLRTNYTRRGDLAPVRLGSRGAHLRVTRLRVLRDVYYRRPVVDGFQGSVQTYPLTADQFFMLGDNSPESRDSRHWDEGHAVPRKYLIGKALLVYWPHTKDSPIPYVTPNFERIRWIR